MNKTLVSVSLLTSLSLGNATDIWAIGPQPVIESISESRPESLSQCTPPQLGLTSISNLQSLSTASTQLAVPGQIAEMMDWEFHWNDATRRQKYRNCSVFEAEYFEIPLSLLTAEVSSKIQPEILNSLVFERDKQKYIKWLINPEDTVFNQKIEAFLKGKNIDSKRHPFGRGFLSASRSCLVQDSISGKTFYFKASTNNTGGAWTNKQTNAQQTFGALTAAEITQSVKSRIKLKSLATLEEPAGFVIEGDVNPSGLPTHDSGINEGLIIRSLGAFPENNHHYVPGFTALHEVKGREIAAKNSLDPDSKKPFQYWQKHLVQPLGRAYAELLATHGFSLTSAHSQQYLIDLDENYVPTGKIIFRDFADSEAIRPFYPSAPNTPAGAASSTLAQKVARLWPLEQSSLKAKPGVLIVVFSLLQGGIDLNNKWGHSKDTFVDTWRDEFMDSFYSRFSELTAVPVSELKAKSTAVPLAVGQSRGLDATGPGLRKWLKSAPCFRGEDLLTQGVSCLTILDCFSLTNQFSTDGYNCSKVSTYLQSEVVLGKFDLKPERETDCDVRNEYYDYDLPAVQELREKMGCSSKRRKI